MASNQFEEIIHNARLRRHKQTLTDKFFSKEKRPSASDTPRRKQSSASRSLASRVEKRVLTAGVGKQQRANPPLRIQENRRLSRLLSDPSPANRPASAAGWNIKGRATGPCVVVGSNFAPGTTAEDVESAFGPIGGTIFGSRLTSSYPLVAVELAFADRQGAKKVVAMFDSQKADGRIIRVQIDPGIDPLLLKDNTDKRISDPKTIKSEFDRNRELANEERREIHGPRQQIQDGRYGFNDYSSFNQNRLYVPATPQNTAWKDKDLGYIRNEVDTRLRDSTLYSDKLVDGQGESRAQTRGNYYR
ncbi:hypothetical protein FQN57_001611 [Myotisia sp. PD_48]|nr:hypothetical protein FQN57_001611 [Myotisia sp. PD_48]